MFGKPLVGGVFAQRGWIKAKGSGRNESLKRLNKSSVNDGSSAAVGFVSLNRFAFSQERQSLGLFRLWHLD